MQHRNGPLHQGRNLLRHSFVQLSRYAHSNALYSAIQAGGVIRKPYPGGGRVIGIIACYCLKHQSAVFNRSRQRPGVI